MTAACCFCACCGCSVADGGVVADGGFEIVVELAADGTAGELRVRDSFCLVVVDVLPFAVAVAAFAAGAAEDLGMAVDDAVAFPNDACGDVVGFVTRRWSDILVCRVALLAELAGVEVLAYSADKGAARVGFVLLDDKDDDDDDDEGDDDEAQSYNVDSIPLPLALLLLWAVDVGISSFDLLD